MRSQQAHVKIHRRRHELLDDVAKWTWRRLEGHVSIVNFTIDDVVSLTTSRTWLDVVSLTISWAWRLREWRRELDVVRLDDVVSELDVVKLSIMRWCWCWRNVFCYRWRATRRTKSVITLLGGSIRIRYTIRAQMCQASLEKIFAHFAQWSAVCKGKLLYIVLDLLAPWEMRCVCVCVCLCVCVSVCMGKKFGNAFVHCCLLYVDE